MNPTPRTLVMLMSAVGLGLSLADAAWSNEQAPADNIAEPAAPLWVEEPQADFSGGLDAHQAVAHDRHAVALALVLMADPPAPHLPRIVTSRKAWAAAMARHLRYERVGGAREANAPETTRDDALLGAAMSIDEPLVVADEADPAVVPYALETLTTEVGFDVPVTAAAESALMTVGLEPIAEDAGVESTLTADPTFGVAPGSDSEPTLAPASVVAAPTPATIDAATTQYLAARAETEIATPIEPAGAAELPAAPLAAPTTKARTPVVFKYSLPDFAPPPAETDAVASQHARHVLAVLAELRAPHPPGGLLGQPATPAKGSLDRVLLDLLVVRTRAQSATTESAFNVDVAATAATRHSRDVATSASAEKPAAPNPFGGRGLAVSAAKLDDVRGGFVTSSGLQLSFGIERAVYLNGNLVTTTSLQLNELGKISGAQGLPVSAELSRALVQNGSGNTFVSNAVSAAALGNIIQNTLDNQKIQTITRIDAAVSAATVLRGIDLQSSMRGAISQSLQR